MEELIKLATKTLSENAINEVELTDSLGNRVYMVKYTPVPCIYQKPWSYQYTYTPIVPAP